MSIHRLCEAGLHDAFPRYGDVHRNRGAIDRAATSSDRNRRLRCAEGSQRNSRGTAHGHRVRSVVQSASRCLHTIAVVTAGIRGRVDTPCADRGA
jgi:hypothetical protein